MKLRCRIFGHRDRTIAGHPGVFCTRCWTMPDGVIVGVDFGLNDYGAAATVRREKDGRYTLLSVNLVPASPSEGAD